MMLLGHNILSGNHPPRVQPTALYLDDNPHAAAYALQTSDPFCRLGDKGNPSAPHLIEKINRLPAHVRNVGLLNELNHPIEQYPGNPQAYQELLGNVASRVIGRRVWAMAPSPDTSGWEDYLRLSHTVTGYQQLHCYGTTVDGLRHHYDKQKALIGNARVRVTELNFGWGNVVNKDQWGNEVLPRFLEYIASDPLCEAAYYFSYGEWDADTPGQTPVHAAGTSIAVVIDTWTKPAPAPQPQPKPPTLPAPKPVKKYTGPMGDYVRVQMPGGAIQEMEIEGPYLWGVVDQETYDAWSAEGAYEALKAQAVAARSFLRNRMAARASQSFDVSTTTNDQAWKANPHADAVRAVNETKGEYVWFGEKIANALYFSQADGKTRSYEEVAREKDWPVVRVPYLVSVDAPGHAPNRRGRHGHGAGMSQWSAYHYARQGWSYRQILAHFYPNTTVDRKPREGSTMERVIKEQAAFWQSSRDGQSVKAIVLHGAGDPNGGTVHSTAAYLTRKNEAGVSSHVVCGYDERDGKEYVYNLVPFNRTANTVAFSRLLDGSTGHLANQRSWSIEGQQLAGKEMPERTRALQFDIVSDLLVSLGWTPAQVLKPSKDRAVLLHSEIDTRGKTCPGPWFYGRGDAVRAILAAMVKEKQMFEDNSPEMELVKQARYEAEDTLRKLEQAYAENNLGKVEEAMDKLQLFVLPNLHKLETGAG